MTPEPRGLPDPLIDETLECLGETEEAWLFHGLGAVQHLAIRKDQAPAGVQRVRVRLEMQGDEPPWNAGVQGDTGGIGPPGDAGG